VLGVGAESSNVIPPDLASKMVAFRFFAFLSYSFSQLTEILLEAEQRTMHQVRIRGKGRYEKETKLYRPPCYEKFQVRG
jgi:hypothetical protein